MLENHLTKALREYIAKALDDLILPAQNGEPRPVQVINGYLPPKRSKENDDFPFVIVRPEKGRVEMGQTVVSIAIIIGCYTEEMDGHEHCLNVYSRIRNALSMMPNQTLDRRYQLAFPLSWVLHAEQPYPLWQIDVSTEWTIITPEIRSEREDEIYGI